MGCCRENRAPTLKTSRPQENIRIPRQPAWAVALLFLLVAPPLAAQKFAAQAADGKIHPDGECVAEHYTIVALPLRPAQINDSAQVAGTTSRRRAALWSQRAGLKEVHLPPGFTSSEGIALNGAGHMVGVAMDADSGNRQAFTFRGDKMMLLPGTQSKPSAINDADEIVGESAIAGTSEAGPVLWKKRRAISLGACCGGAAAGINGKGQVIGAMYDKQATYHAFLWDSSHGIQPIGPSKDYSSALAINQAGHVILQAFPYVLFYADGKTTRLDLSPRYRSEPRGLNDCDVIVGSFGPHSNALRAFVWDKPHGFGDLNDRVPPNTGWKLEAATSINNRGEIVGWGDYKGVEDSGFLLLPEW